LIELVVTIECKGGEKEVRGRKGSKKNVPFTKILNRTEGTKKESGPE